jgi:hypothetical protein
MAVTRWKSNLYIPGSVVAGYYGNVAGTAYMLMQGLGTSYKLSAGTAKLVAGSASVTSNLTSVVAAVASPAYWGTAGAGVYAGTIPVGCAYKAGAGTLSLIAAPAGAYLGTCFVNWVAVGT